MKARIKKTGEIVEVYIYSKSNHEIEYCPCVHCGECQHIDIDDVDIFVDPFEELEKKHAIIIHNDDMPSEKRMKFEICKRVISSLEVHSGSTIESDCKLALDISNEMMKQWKESEEPE